MRRWLILLLLIAAACAPSGGATSVPTLTLIASTATITPTPVPPTSTPANLPAPQNFTTPQPQSTATPSGTPAELTGSALIAADPVAESLVGIAERLVATQVNLPTNLVSVVDVRTAVWTDSTLDCPAPGSQAVPTQTDGYRILLRAANQEFLFHTDVDRVVPCDPADEHLPPGVVVPTEAPTSAATSAA